MTPYSPSIGPSNLSASKPIAPPSQVASSKGKQPESTTDASSKTFLAILFDREDYLRGTSDSEDEDEGEVGRILASFLDPRLLTQDSTLDAAGTSLESPVESVRSRRHSPRKDRFPKSRGLTHLGNRQPMANTLRVHPNLNLQNLFGNLPFSSSVRANNYPLNVQDAQVNNLFLPMWAMMTVSTRPDPGSLKEAFYSLFRDTTAMIESGTPVESIIEIHPNIAALFDEEEYNTSGILSRWSASMVHSAQLRGMSRHTKHSNCTIYTPSKRR